MRQDPQVERFHEASCPYALALIPFWVDMNAARMLLSLGSPALPEAVQHEVLGEGKAFISRYDAPGCRGP